MDGCRRKLAWLLGGVAVLVVGFDAVAGTYSVLVDAHANTARENNVAVVPLPAGSMVMTSRHDRPSDEDANRTFAGD